MKIFVVLVAALAFAGCAANYGRLGEFGSRGGYKEQQIKPDVFRLTFRGTGETTKESMQTYWLYRAAELSLEKGFAGFEILSSISFVLAPDDSPYVPAQFIFIPITPPPLLEADILLLKSPIAPSPPKVFDARALKAELEIHVKGEKRCDSGNICPHFKSYLRPAAPRT